MAEQQERWALIINTKSGKKKFRQQINYLFESLTTSGIAYEYQFTRFAGHAQLIAARFVRQNFRNFLVVGGDGTISEVVNGIFSTNSPLSSAIKLAIIPRGTGNDWARFWGLNRNYKHSTEVFLKQKTQLIDIGKVNYSLEGENHTHFFINSAGFGLDAAVVRITNHLRRYFGSHSFLYFFALLSAVFTYRAAKTELKFNGKFVSKNLFTMNIANGCYSGGGMKQNPNALPFDGLMDGMAANKPTFIDILKALTMLFNGKLLEHPVIESFRSPKIEIHIDENTCFEADGILVHSEGNFEVETITGGIQMIVP